MKRTILLLILIFLFVVASIVVVTFEVSGRINYFRNGMASFNDEKYTITDSQINEKCKIIINDSSIVKKDLTVLELTNGLKLILNDITYNGTSYTLKVTSVGESTYSNGQILFLSDGPDKMYDTDLGTIIFQKIGTDGIVNDSIVNYYCVYPMKEVNAAEMAKLDITVIIDNIIIRNYQKK